MEKTKNTFHDHVINWEAPEYVQHEKGWMWFLVAGIAMLGLAIYAAFTDNWTLVVALIVIAAVYVWQHGQTPKHVKILISKTGIKVGEKEYLYQNIKNFWIIYNPPHVKTLNIKSNSSVMPDLAIQLGDQDPAELRTFLCAYVREDEDREETTGETLVRILKL